MRILHNTRCCISLAALHTATVGDHGKAEMPCLRLKSEDSLLDRFGRLREYDRVCAVGLLFLRLPGIFQNQRPFY